MPFVLDASVTLAWCLSEASSPAADAALDRLRADFALVPSGWHDEVANGFLVAERRNRITAVGTAAQLARLRALDVRVVASSDASWGQALGLARAHGLTAYDAAYLALAVRERAPLATLDDDLRDAARRVGVALVIRAAGCG